MASIKLILRKEVKADRTSALAIRITKDRRSSYVYLDYILPELIPPKICTPSQAFPMINASLPLK